MQRVPQVQVYPDQAGRTVAEKQLFPTEHDALPRVQDHGFLYFTSAEELANRSPMVQKALSTRTATLHDMRRFRKHQLINKFKTHTFDTGSSRVQVALLTARIQAMTAHLAASPRDSKGKRTLQSLVARRRQLMQYMLKHDYANYRVIIKELNLKAVPFKLSKYTASRPQKTEHKILRARHARIKNRSGRGHKGH